MARLPSISDFCFDLGTASYGDSAVSKAGDHSWSICRCDDIADLLLFAMDSGNLFAELP